VADHGGLIRFANPSAVAALGYDDVSELLGKPSHQTIHYKRPDGSPFPAEECPLLLPRTTGETIHRADDWFVRRDGSIVPVEYWSAPLDGPAGRGAVVAFRDVSERRRAEEVLRERDAILSALGQPVYVGTPDGLITYANPAAVAVLGFGDASELIGQDGHWLVHYKHRDGSRYPIEECPIARCRDTGDPVRIEEDWLVRKDGSMIPATCTAVPFEAPGGYGIAVSFTDLSTRLAAEQATREREIAEARAAELSAGEARHHAILAAALDGVIIIDQRGCVTYVNAAAERIFGYRADQVLGRELAEAFLPPSLREAHRRGLARHPPANGQAVGCCPSAADASPRPRSQLPGHARAARRAHARAWHQIRGRGAGHRRRQRLGRPDRHHNQPPAAAGGHRTAPRKLRRPDRDRGFQCDRPLGADRLP
jgi:PAS domain S-box-containing protein